MSRCIWPDFLLALARGAWSASAACTSRRAAAHPDHARARARSRSITSASTLKLPEDHAQDPVEVDASAGDGAAAATSERAPRGRSRQWCVRAACAALTLLADHDACAKIVVARWAVRPRDYDPLLEPISPRRAPERAALYLQPVTPTARRRRTDRLGVARDDSTENAR